MDAGQQGMKINRVLRFISIVVMMVGFGVFTANAQTISGEIGGEETWSGVVFLSGDVTITETGNLTILPGTRIECEPKFDDQVGGQNSSRIEIIVDGGILSAVGTQESPILFTSADEVPEDDDWYGIRIQSDTVTMRHCIVEYADYGLVIEQNGLPVVERCVFRNNFLDGIRIDTPDTYRFDDCEMSGNSRNGVFSTKQSSITLTGCSIHLNGSNGLFVNGETTIQSCEIVQNKDYGARISHAGSTHTITDTLINRNQNTGLYTDKGAAFFIRGCTVTHNGENNPRDTADGIFGKEPLNVTDCVIADNSRAGISLVKIGSEGITRNTITGNQYGVQFNSKASLLEMTGGNDIYNNTDYELINQETAAIVSGPNYLGELTTDELKAGNRNPGKIFDSRDDRSVGEILVRVSLEVPLSSTATPSSFTFDPAIPGDVSIVAPRVISEEVTWSGKVLLLGDVTVTETGILTIQPGTRIESDPRYDDRASGYHTSRTELLIDGGVLNAVGTESNPIVFTSGDELPDKNDWYGVRIKSDTVTMRHCTVERGDIGLLIEQNGLPVVERSVFQDNAFNGIKVETPDTYRFDGCTITDNGGYGVLSRNKASIFLTGCVIDGNGQDGLLADGTVHITGCAISNNNGYGASISGLGSIHTVEDSTVIGNDKTGLYTINGNAFNIYRCVITQNGQPNDRIGADGIFGKMPLNVMDCVIRENSGAGISFVTLGTEGIARNAISANKYGVQFNSKDRVTTIAGQNDIYNNVEYELINLGSAAAVITDNYLGELTADELKQGKRNLTKIFDSRDDRLMGEINIPTFLDQSMSQIPSPRPITFRLEVPSEVSIVSSGIIAGEETWSGVVFLLGDVTVTESGILTILPGTRILCDPQFDNTASGIHSSRTELTIDGGVLNAIGTASEPILLSSAAETPEPGDWFGVRIASDKVTMRYCSILNGHTGLLVEQNGMPIVERCTIQNNRSNGIHIDTPDTYRFDSCVISENGGFGVYTKSKAAISLTHCSIDSNGDHGVFTDGQTDVNGCLVRYNLGSGVLIDGKDFSHSILDSAIGENLESGIFAGKGIELTVTGSTVFKNGLNNTRVTADGVFSRISLSITDCTIGENTGAGLSFDQIGSEGITGNVLTGNRFGIQFNSKASVLELTGGNDIFNNTDYELKNQEAAAIVADGNYLGELTTSELIQGKDNLTKIYDSRDNRSVGAINIRTWVEEPLKWNPPAPTPIQTPTPTNTPVPDSPTNTPTPTLTPTPVNPQFVKGDVNLDGFVTPMDAQAAFDLYVNVITGTVTPARPFAAGSAIWAADISDDGRLTPGDIQAVFDRHIQSIRECESSSSTTPEDLPESVVTVKAGSVQGVPGARIKVPVLVTGLEGIKAFSFSLQFDSRQLEYIGLDRSGTSTEAFSTVTAVPIPGRVVVSGFAGSAEMISGDSVLIDVIFQIDRTASGIPSILPGDFLDGLEGSSGIDGDVILEDPAGGEEVMLIVSEVTAHSGDTVTVPVEIQGAIGVRSFSFVIKTDYTFLRFSHIEKEITLSERFSSLLGIENAEGEITIAGFSGSGTIVHGDGVLIGLVFDVLESESDSATIALSNLSDDLESAFVTPGKVSMTTPVIGWMIY